VPVSEGEHLDQTYLRFDTAMIGRTGAGYFAATISSNLKGYLLQVKREFFRFRLFQVMQMRSSYAMRTRLLYDLNANYPI
jgi:Initiator Replication protein